MRTEKVSFILEEKLLAEASKMAGARGLSCYVNRALRNQLQRDRVALFLAALDEEEGPVEPAVLEEIRQAWAALGKSTG